MERLIELLSRGRHNVSELARTLGVSVPTVSRWLRKIRDSGVPVAAERRGGRWIMTLAGPPAPFRLPRRKPDSHKTTYGRVCVIAGSYGMAGAAALVCLGAYRAGAGLVYLACPDRIADVLAAKLTEVVLLPQPSTSKGALARLEGDFSRYDVIAIGPGLGRDPRTARAVLDVLHTVKQPTVADADAINALSERPRPIRPDVVLTPHEGELSRLIKVPAEKIHARRRAIAQDTARRFNCVLLLKGHRTIVTDGRRTYVNPTGNPGMATGGVGDVLTGVIAALIGQGLGPYQAACLGAYVHGLAGDLAARDLGEVSLMAGDLVSYLPKAFAR